MNDMDNKADKNVREIIISCLENVGMDSNLMEDSDGKNVLDIMDSLQYISFIAEVENHLAIDLTDEFLVLDNFTSFEDFMVKLEYYVKGWKESCHNNYQTKEGEKNETQEVEKDVT